MFCGDDGTLKCARNLDARDLNTPNDRENVCVKVAKCGVYEANFAGE